MFVDNRSALQQHDFAAINNHTHLEHTKATSHVQLMHLPSLAVSVNERTTIFIILIIPSTPSHPPDPSRKQALQTPLSKTPQTPKSLQYVHHAP